MSQNGSCSTSVLCDKMFLVERSIKDIKKKICCIPEYQYQDEGIDLGTPQTVKFIDFIGDGVTASFSGNKITVDVPNSGLQLPNTFTNTNTANITLSGPMQRNIQVDVKVSAVGGNTITVNSDGLYSAGGVYTFSTGLTDNASVITANLSTGISGGQSVIGGTGANETLTLSSTTFPTKGKILFGTSAYDELNNRLGIGTISPINDLHISKTGPVTANFQSTTSSSTLTISSAVISTLILNGVSTNIQLAPRNNSINNPSFMTPVGSYTWLSFGNSHHDQISGNGVGVNLDQRFHPTSGTSTFSMFEITGQINQTGGANGITRGILINSTLTAAPDHRALEISNNSGKAIYQTGGSASNYFAGFVGLGSPLATTARFHMIDNVIDPAPRSSAIWDITWNTASNVTAFLMNVALTGAGAGAASRLVDIQQAGISRLWVDLNAGTLQVTGGGIRIGSIGGSGYGGISLAGGSVIPQTIHSGDAISFVIAGLPAQTIYTFSMPVNAPTSGDWYSMQLKTPVTGEFDPSSGNANYTVLYIDTIYNQTGTATGITRGIHLNPFITAVVDYRAIEISNNSQWAIYQSGAGAKSLFAGTLRFTGLPTYADEAAAGAGGLITGDVYMTATGELRIKL